jgi:acyl-CoA thioesterase FadM
LLDEAMGETVWQAGYMVLAVNLSVNYRRPLPLDIPVQITAGVERNEGRKVYTRSEIRLPDGQAVVEGTGIFVEAPHTFSQFAESYQAYRQNNASSSEEAQ